MTSTEWRQASVYQLPFEDASTDIVLSAQAVQFFKDRQKALAEMKRILKPNRHK